jgi:hypothetical protein
MLVGVHYKANGLYVQLAEWGGPGGFKVVAAKNPARTTWSGMVDVSCLSPRFCMIVGDAGSAKTQHVTSYIWNGRSFRAVTVPAPPHSRIPELAGVSCTSSESCEGVGFYENAASAYASYAAIWHGGKWHLQTAPSITGGKGTILTHVSCWNASGCMAVGSTETSHPVVESWTGHAWRLVSSPALSYSGLQSVSCLSSSFCYASGWSGSGDGLLERWNGAAWTVVQRLSPAPQPQLDMEGVSCISPTSCAAVGVRFNPSNKYPWTYRTVAERWNGKTWTMQSSASS